MKKYFKYFKYFYFYNERIILPLKRSLNNWSYLVFILISPILIVNFFLSVIYEHTIGERLVHYQMKKDMKGSFVHDIAIVSISKNEGPYLLEWIEFHRIVGVTKFFFYDNDSDDNTRELLQPYIDSGIVDYVLVKGKGQQLNAYNDAIQKHKNECRWMAFIDMDEYLIPSQGGMLGETMQRLFEGRNDGAAGIGVNWATFGTSGHKNRLPPPITEKLLNRAENNYWTNFHVKTICNPRLVANYISPHYPHYRLGAYSISDTGKRQWGWSFNDVQYNNLRINHYYCKSEEDYLKKISRGLGDRVGSYDMSRYKYYDKNDVHDELMLRYKSELSKRLKSF